MATIKRSFTSEQAIYRTDGFGGSDPDVGSTEQYSSGVDLETNGYIGAHVIVEADFPASPTDDLEVRFYASLDGSNWDDKPFYSFTIENDTDPCQVSVIITDFAHFRVGLKASGNTDTIDVQVKYKAWNYVTS